MKFSMLRSLADTLHAIGDAGGLQRGHQIRIELRVPGATTGHRTVAVVTITDNGAWRASDEDRSSCRTIDVKTVDRV